jgi:hypothetical protein
LLRELGSTNGTSVNGHQVQAGQEVTLALGDELKFADEEWTFCNADEPAPAAILAGGRQTCLIQNGVLNLPDGERPLASIFRGIDGDWTLEVGDHVRSLRSGEVFHVGEQSWTFWSPTIWQPTARTRRPRLVRGSTLVFDVSQDEEHVSLTVEAEHDQISMGQLSGYYFLLTLARLRDVSGQAEPPRDAQSGWVHREELTRMLRCGEQQINVWIHRIRSRFSRMGFLDYAGIVERRDGTGQMRLGSFRTVIRAI